MGWVGLSDFTLRLSDLWPWLSDFTPRLSDLWPWLSDLRPRLSDFALTLSEIKNASKIFFLGCARQINYSIHSRRRLLKMRDKRRLRLSLIFPSTLHSYAILAPMTNDRPSEIVNEMKPTERLSLAIS